MSRLGFSIHRNFSRGGARELRGVAGYAIREPRAAVGVNERHSRMWRQPLLHRLILVSATSLALWRLFYCGD